jgi:hypothetical protein
LHGLLRGEGDGSLLNWGADAKWQVVSTEEASLVSLGLKVKFQSCEVLFCGDRLGATSFLTANLDRQSAIVGGTATAGYNGTATAGDSGTATAGYRGTATAGDNGVIVLAWYDYASGRRRVAVGYIGENGILPNTPYRLNDNHQFEVSK